MYMYRWIIIIFRRSFNRISTTFRKSRSCVVVFYFYFYFIDQRIRINKTDIIHRDSRARVL